MRRNAAAEHAVAIAVRTGRARDDIARLPEPRPLDRYLRELRAAKQEQRRRDARLPFDEKVEIVLGSRRRPA